MKVLSSFSFLAMLIVFSLMSFNLPKNIRKKVDKEIKLQFSVDDHKLEPITVSDEINAKLQKKINGDNLFKVITDNGSLGYAYIGKAPSKTAEFDYLVVFDKDLIIVKAKVLFYREDYGGEIGSKRWLKQFIGKTKQDRLEYEKDIIAISGATISARAMTIAVNNVLKTVATLHENDAI